MTTELDWWERKHRMRHEDDVERPLMFRCFVCRKDTFSPTGIVLPCFYCKARTRMEIVWEGK